MQCILIVEKQTKSRLKLNSTNLYFHLELFKCCEVDNSQQNPYN